MSELCEIVESVGEATSSMTAELVVMATNSATAVSSVVLGVSLVLSSAGVAVDTADPSSYALLTSTGVATTTASGSMTMTEVSENAAKAVDSMFVEIPLMLSSAAVGTTSVVSDIEMAALVSTGIATSQATPSISITSTVSSTAAATSAVTVYLDEEVTSDAVATTSATWLVHSTGLLTSEAVATSTISASNVPTLPILESIGIATSTITAQTEWTVVSESTAVAVSAVVFKDPGRVAWLMNTESAAVSWYDNFDFESIAQVNGVSFATGPGGIYELTGDDDDGDQIDASLRSGFMDFGTQQQKHVDSFYFGYTSDGILRALLSTKDSRHPTSVFNMEEREADAPTNSRIVPGKGMVGTYWQVEMRNVSGAAFTVYDVSADLAISSRKL